MSATANRLEGAPRAIIFDCDGVLIDSWDSTMYFYNRIREILGLRPLSREEEDYVWVSTVRDGLDRVTPPELTARAWEEVARLDWDDMSTRVKVEPGLPEFLSFLRDAEIEAAVNTNGGNEAPRILAMLGISNWFRTIVTADDVARPKPHPEGAEKILGILGISRDRTVFIGDSAVDQKTARAAGLRFWAYKNPGLEADYHVSEYGELKKELTRLAAAEKKPQPASE
ncbi:MAG: HAD hydrolase-like protein [Pseudomonadota bacterium]